MLSNTALANCIILLKCIPVQVGLTYMICPHWVSKIYLISLFDWFISLFIPCSNREDGTQDPVGPWPLLRFCFVLLAPFISLLSSIKKTYNRVFNSSSLFLILTTNGFYSSVFQSERWWISVWKIILEVSWFMGAWTLIFQVLVQPVVRTRHGVSPYIITNYPGHCWSYEEP